MNSGINKILRAAVLIPIILIAALSSCSVDRNVLSVDILDIGKADCILLRYGEQTIMIDTGEEEDLTDINKHLVTSGVNRIDHLIISHFDKDHVGGAADIVGRFDVENVYMSAFEKDSEQVRAFLSALDDKGIKPNRLTQNAGIHIEELTLTLSPPKKTSYKEKEDNNASLVVTAQLGQNRLLFCGDAMEERIDELLSEEIEDIDFIKLPYHGRSIGNLDRFLDKTDPAYCAITCSKKNPPNEETIDLLEQRNIKTYLTENGTIRVRVLSDSITVRQ